MKKTLLALSLAVLPSAAFAVPMQPKDVLQACGFIDAMTIRAYELPEAVNLLNGCFANVFGGRLLTVRAETGRFEVPCVPESRLGLSGCRPEWADGIVVRVAGKLLMGDATPGDVAFGIQKRGGRLLGFPAKVDTSLVHLAH